MSIIFGVYDPNPVRRCTAIGYRPKVLDKLPWLIEQEHHFGNLSIFLATSTTTPVSVAEEHEAGRKALVLGDFVTDKPGSANCAKYLLEQALVNGQDCVSGQNGYYLGLLYEPDVGLSIGTDVLGYFPLFYWHQNDVFLFSSSLTFFKGHPCFSTQTDHSCITSLLLFSHPSGGQTILKGVKRHLPGHRVQWSPYSSVANEYKANPLKVCDSLFSTPYSQVRDRFHELFSQIAAQTKSFPNLSFFLSGGQDSRLMAGYFGAERSSTSITALSLGGGLDRELEYAKRTSSALGWRHLSHDFDFDDFLDFAGCQLELEQLDSTFVNPGNWTAINELQQINHPFVSGYFGDPTMGETFLKPAYNLHTGEYEFNMLFASINRYGFSSKVTAQLIGQQLVDETRQSLHNSYLSYEGYPFQKAWQFGWYNRSRHHVSPIVWRLSLGAWPKIPYLDRKILDTSGSMPLNYFIDRRIQADLLRMHFPQLAKIPFDRNAILPGYLIKPMHAKLETCANILIPKWVYLYQKYFKRLTPQKERRYYYRVYDFNNPGWMKIREAAEKFRNDPNPVLNTALVSELIPPADTKINLHDPIVESSKLKTLTGIILWSNALNSQDNKNN